MKRTDNHFQLELISERGMEFINDFAAIAAATQLQMYFAMQGYMVTSHINGENGSYEITIHFSGKHYPSHPQGYNYSEYSLTSQEAWIGKAMKRIRCKSYYFRVKTTMK